MIKKLRIAVDHGNQNMKTCNFVFSTGLTVLDKKPARGEQYLQYGGKYYMLSERRIPYQRDKTKDSRFYILTLFAVAKELERMKVSSEDLVQIELPIGLPPKHFAELYDVYEKYFLGKGEVITFTYNGQMYHISMKNVQAFPQDYAAIITQLDKLGYIPKAVGVDIGGFTADYLLMRAGKPDMDYCDSLEKGIITMYNQIISDVNSEYDILLEDTDIDSILKGQTQYYDDHIIRLVVSSAQKFVTDLLASIRERGVDIKSAYVVFIGGGAVLLKSFLEKADRLGHYMFIEDLCANAKGYDILYQISNDRK